MSTTTYTRQLLARWEWRMAALSFVLIAAEACLVSLVIGVVAAPDTLSGGGAASEGGAGGIHPLAVLAVMLVAAAVPRLAETLQLWSPEYEIAIGAGVVCTLLGMLYACAFVMRYAFWDVTWLREAANAYIFRPTTATASVWLIGAVIIYAWVRGRLRDIPSLDTAYTTLRFGTIIVAVTSVLTLTSQDATSPSQRYVRPLVIGFFFCALSAITVARLQVEGLRAQGRLGPQWLGPLLLPVALVLIGGTLVAALLSRRLLETITGLLAPVFAILEFILRIIIAIISLIAYLLYILLSALLGALAGGRQNPLPAPAAPPRDFARQADHAVATLPDNVRYVLLGAMLVLVVALLSRFLFRKPHRTQRDGEERESVLDWNDIGAGLRGALANLRRRLQRAPDPFADLRGDPRWEHTVRIRTLYTRLLYRGKRAGAPRKPSDAPREYVPKLETVFPEADAPLVALTDVYRAARYADRPATAAEATAAAAAFGVITGTATTTTDGK